MLKTLTVFTPTYNRAHTLIRTYESLLSQTCRDFEWLIIDDGSTDKTQELVNVWMADGNITIRYVYKNNGGLFSGYNKAIEVMDSELCVCIDSDDYMPDDAVENIISLWKTNGNKDYAGIIGLDFMANGTPIGGYFPEKLKETHIYQLYKYHQGDVKMVHRVELLKKVAPVELFKGEKFANPIYIYMLVDKDLPMLVTNQNFCFVEYQQAGDSMSKNILYQYAQSPRSLARMRLLNMSNRNLAYSRRFRNAIHYVSSCIMAKDSDWLRNSPIKASTILAVPFGIILCYYIKWKVANKNNSYQ